MQPMRFGIQFVIEFYQKHKSNQFAKVLSKNKYTQK